MGRCARQTGSAKPMAKRWAAWEGEAVRLNPPNRNTRVGIEVSRQLAVGVCPWCGATVRTSTNSAKKVAY